MALLLDREFYEKKYGKDVVILRVESTISDVEYTTHWALIGVGPGPTDDRSEISFLEPLGTITKWVGTEEYDIAWGSREGELLHELIEPQAEREAFDYLNQLPIHWID